MIKEDPLSFSVNTDELFIFKSYLKRKWQAPVIWVHDLYIENINSIVFLRKGKIIHGTPIHDFIGLVKVS